MALPAVFATALADARDSAARIRERPAGEMPSVQRQADPERLAAEATSRPPRPALDLLFPDFALRMPASTEANIEALLADGDYPAALASMLAFLESTGQVDLSLLSDRTIGFDAALTGSPAGRATPVWTSRMRSDGRWQLNLQGVTVRVGPGTMTSPQLLHSSLLHEWRHVQQYYELDGEILSGPLRSGSMELAWLPGLSPAQLSVLQEIDAYHFQVRHAASGSQLSSSDATTLTWSLGPYRGPLQAMQDILPAEVYDHYFSMIDRTLQSLSRYREP